MTAVVYPASFDAPLPHLRDMAATVVRSAPGHRRTRIADEDVVRALYDMYGKALLTTMVAETRDQQWAEDIVQETLLRAWRNLDKLDLESGSLLPWLVTVARRIAIDGYRSRKVRPLEVPETGLEIVLAADEIDRATTRMLVAEAVRTLPKQQRDVIVELYVRGCSASQAAASLGIPHGTVKSRAHHALVALRVALRARGVSAAA